MLNILKPKKSDRKFYDLFSGIIKTTCIAAEKLEELFTHYTDTDQKIKALEEMEHACDRMVHDLINHLNHAFITPFDREDIFLITKVIDNIMDYIESTAYRLKLMNIPTIREESLEMTGLIKASTRELEVVFSELDKMKTSRVLQPKIVEINRLENQGDETYRKIMRNLFLYEKDPVELMKWKEIYEYLEKTLDACEDVANLIEGVVSKNA